MRKLVLLCAMAMLLLPQFSFGQTRQITGRVTDDRGEPLSFVSVLQKGTNSGTTTNDRGEFTLNVSGASPVLVLSYAGMQTQELAIGSSSNYNISLRSDGAMSEVVVTALGIRREKKSLGYSSQEVKTAELTQSRQPNLVNALQGRATGLRINSGGGAPGEGARIIMRGITSLDVNREMQPLFIVDGIPIDNSTDVTTGAIRGMTNRAADINPDDIESITVLKGGAATALYGLRASTGAIIITTKSGRAGRVRASVTSTYGFEEVNKFPDVQKTFTQGFSGVYDSSSFWPSWGPTVAEAKLRDKTHPDELFNNYERGYETGNFLRNTVQLSGGTDRSTFAAAFSHYKHDGVLPFSDYKNYSIKVNGDTKFSEKFRFGSSINFINSGGNRKNADRYNEQLSYWSPRWDVMDYVKPDGTMKVYGIDNDNPVFVASQRHFIDDVNRIIGNLNFTWSPAKWVDFTYRVGADVISDARTETAPGPTGKPGELFPYSDFRGDRTSVLGGFIEEYHNRRRIINSTAMLQFKKDFGTDLNTSLRLGHDVYDTRSRYVQTFGDTLSDPTFFNLNNARRITGSNGKSEYRIIGAFADLTLGWKDFLFLNLTGRNDWTSTLPVENRSFFYPSASLSYVISEHLDFPGWMSYLKLRGSVAKIGKDAPPYSFSAGFQSLSPAFQGGVTLADRSGDPNLQPEFTTSKEGGFEARAISNRLGLDFTYYNNTSKDLIIPVSVTTSTGLNEIYLNAGSISNKGVELSLMAIPFKTSDFNWEMRINYTRNKSKVLEIYPGLTEITIGSQFGYLSSNVTQKFIVGQPVGALFGRTYARYYGSDKEDPLFIDYSRPILISATTGYPVLNPAAKQQFLGNSQPDWIGSLYNELSWKQLSLSFLFDTQQGIEKYNQMSNFMSAFGIAPYTTDRRDLRIFDGVTPDGQKNTKQITVGQAFYRDVHRGSSENFIEDASFVKLRNVTLSYGLPSTLLARTKVISGASVALSGNNLWLKTDYTGFDPESSSSSSGSVADGFAGFTYPQTRSYMITLNLTF